MVNQYYENPQEMDFSNLENPATITLEVSNMPADFVPQCVFAQNVNATTGLITWSEEGCQVQEVRNTEKTVVCECYHLSIFSVGENLVPESSGTDLVISSDSDDQYIRFPVMIIFLGAFLMAIIITIIAEKVRNRKNQQIKTDRPQQQPTMVTDSMPSKRCPDFINDIISVVHLEKSSDIVQNDLFQSISTHMDSTIVESSPDSYHVTTPCTESINSEVYSVQVPTRGLKANHLLFGAFTSQPPS